jgi:hypothetical protein
VFQNCALLRDWLLAVLHDRFEARQEAEGDYCVGDLFYPCLDLFDRLVFTCCDMQNKNVTNFRHYNFTFGGYKLVVCILQTTLEMGGR